MTVRNVCAVMTLAATLGVQGAWAMQVERTNAEVFKDVSRAVNGYVRFTIFDDVSAQIDRGTVTLVGKVTMPYKRDDLEKLVGKVEGVSTVVNQIEVLPTSSWDNELRYRIARAIYGNAHFWNLAVMAHPPIHIVVERGHVTLTGVVQSEVDRALARALVPQFGVFSIENALRTDQEAREAIEKLS
jgi:osmotically-inducible protein OsmY